MYKYLFGPVPSRRLGISLGVDLVPKKVCSLDCVYCEVGKTTLHTSDRKEYIPFEKLIKELKYYLENNTMPDFLTLTGSGEPTLNSRLGDIIDFIKQNFPKVPVAVITNGTLLTNPEVINELKKADVVLPSLDAATDNTFKKINGPLPDHSVKDHVEGLIKFRECFKGQMWLEVFVLPGYNNKPEEINELKSIIEKIAPDAVQLNTLDRPGVLKDLQPAMSEELEEIADFLSLPSIELIVNKTKQQNTVIEKKDITPVILNTLIRRPCTLDDLIKITGQSEDTINKHLTVLQKKGVIESFQQKRGIFFRIK